MDESQLTALVGKIQAGEQAALGQLYDQTVGRVYKVALRITAKHADAEEVTCDTYLQVWRTAAQFDPLRGGPEQWITAIARTRALDRYRRSQASSELLRRGASKLSQPESESIVEGLLEQFEVHAWLPKLPSIQIQLIRLAYFEGLSHRDIAARTGWPLGTVKSNLRRALRALRQMMTCSDPTRVEPLLVRSTQDNAPPQRNPIVLRRSPKRRGSPPNPQG